MSWDDAALDPEEWCWIKASSDLADPAVYEAVDGDRFREVWGARYFFIRFAPLVTGVVGLVGWLVLTYVVHTAWRGEDYTPHPVEAFLIVATWWIAGFLSLWPGFAFIESMGERYTRQINRGVREYPPGPGNPMIPVDLTKTIPDGPMERPLMGDDP